MALFLPYSTQPGDPVATAIFCTGVALFFIWQGCRRAAMSEEEAWKREEARLAVNGIRAECTPEWREANARRPGSFFAFAAMIFFMGMFLLGIRSSRTEMSGAFVFGHELTKQQWDSCGQDPLVCSNMYPNGAGR